MRDVRGAMEDCLLRSIKMAWLARRHSESQRCLKWVSSVENMRSAGERSGGRARKLRRTEVVQAHNNVKGKLRTCLARGRLRATLPRTPSARHVLAHRSFACGGSLPARPREAPGCPPHGDGGRCAHPFREVSGAFVFTLPRLRRFCNERVRSSTTSSHTVSLGNAGPWERLHPHR